MAIRTPNWLTAFEAKLIRTDLEDLTNTTRANAQVTYRRFNAGAAQDVDASANFKPVGDAPYTETAVYGYLGQVQGVHIEQNPSLQITDKRFLFKRSQVSGELTLLDQVVFSGVEYNVIDLRETKHGIAGNSDHTAEQATDLAVVTLRATGSSGG